MWFGGIAPIGDSPKTNLLNDFIYGASVFWYQQKKFWRWIFWHSLGVLPPPRPSSNRPPKINFWLPHTRALVFFYYQPMSKRRMFWHRLEIPHWRPPKKDPSNIIFVWLKLVCQFYFLVSTDTTNKYFDIVWGFHFPSKPPKVDPHKSNFARPNLWCLCFSYHYILQRQKFWQSSRAPPPEDPPNRPPKHQFFQQLKLEFYFLFDVMKHCKDKHLDILWRCHPPKILK